MDFSEKLEAYDGLERDEWREKINIDKFVYEDILMVEMKACC